MAAQWATGLARVIGKYFRGIHTFITSLHVLRFICRTSVPRPSWWGGDARNRRTLRNHLSKAPCAIKAVRSSVGGVAQVLESGDRYAWQSNTTAPSRPCGARFNRAKKIVIIYVPTNVHRKTCRSASRSLHNFTIGAILWSSLKMNLYNHLVLQRIRGLQKVGVRKRSLAVVRASLLNSYYEKREIGKT